MAQYSIPSKREQVLWAALLIAVSAISTLGFACVTPFAAFAVAAAYALPARSAVFAVTGVWIANQAIGFTSLGYPWTVDTVLWGLAIGASAMIATACASLTVLNRSKRSVAASLGLALPSAFVVYESCLFLVTLSLGGQEAFTPSIIATFALINLGWAVALVVAREGLRWIIATVQPWPRLLRAQG